MTVFTKSDLPEDADTVEKVALWAMNVLVANYPNKTFYESRDNEVRAIGWNPFFNDSDELDREKWGWHLIARLSLPLADSYSVGGIAYQHALSLGEIAIPDELKPQVV